MVHLVQMSTSVYQVEITTVKTGAIGDDEIVTGGVTSTVTGVAGVDVPIEGAAGDDVISLSNSA